MLKRLELSEPNSCLNKAHDEELIFVLREVDVAAPGTVRDWCSRRIKSGKNHPDDAQIVEALQWADRVEKIHENTQKFKEKFYRVGLDLKKIEEEMK